MVGTAHLGMINSPENVPAFPRNCVSAYNAAPPMFVEKSVRVSPKPSIPSSGSRWSTEAVCNHYRRKEYASISALRMIFNHLRLVSRMENIYRCRLLE